MDLGAEHSTDGSGCGLAWWRKWNCTECPPPPAIQPWGTHQEPNLPLICLISLGPNLEKSQPKNNTHISVSPLSPQSWLLNSSHPGGPQPRVRVHCRLKPPSRTPAPGPCKLHGTSVLSLEPIVCYLGRGYGGKQPLAQAQGRGSSRDVRGQQWLVTVVCGLCIVFLLPMFLSKKE